MSINLVGVFDSEAEARQACSRLESAGFDKASIRAEPAFDRSGSASVPREDRRGFFARLFGIGDDDESVAPYGEAVDRGNTVITVSLSDEQRSDEVADILEDCGAIDVDERAQQWQADGYVPMATQRVGDDSDKTMGQTLQSVEEELQVGKRVAQRGSVRIYRSVSERPVEEQVTLTEEHAAIERKKVDRPASEAELRTAFEDRDIEIRETAEEPVVSKTARVVEEVELGKKSSQRTETVRDTLRSSRVEVDDDGDGDGDGDAMPSRRARSTYGGAERRVQPLGSYHGVERRASL